MKNIVRLLREKKKMTQEDLSRLVGVRRETIVFLEQGKYNPSLLLAAKIAHTFGKKIEEVFEVEGE